MARLRPGRALYPTSDAAFAWYWQQSLGVGVPAHPMGRAVALVTSGGEMQRATIEMAAWANMGVAEGTEAQMKGLENIAVPMGQIGGIQVSIAALAALEQASWAVLAGVLVVFAANDIHARGCRVAKLPYS